MENYQPQYQILSQDDLVPKEQIVLIPEDKLSLFYRTELANLRRGVGHNLVVADNPQNREMIAVKTMYFQMVAYKEGWVFDSQLYQVHFVDPRDPILKSVKGHTRILDFKEGATVEGVELSPRNNLGIHLITEDGNGVMMSGEEADGLVSRVSSLFGSSR